MLFVPGDRPDRYAKALGSGSDSVCVDLEDAVGPAAKEAARRAALEYLGGRAPGGTEVILRINSPRTEEGLRDLLGLRESEAAPDALLIPKVETAAEVGWIEGLLPSRLAAVDLIVMIETARGLAAVEEIGRASGRIAALLLGGVDLSAELGCTREWDSLLYARSRIVHAAAMCGADAMDVPVLDVADHAGLLDEARAVARLGFTGKAAIHPTQVEAIQSAFSPSPEEVERARAVVEAYERSSGGVLLLDGRLIERPVVRAALRTLAAARHPH
jgi:citrate lyase beta subunit